MTEVHTMRDLEYLEEQNRQLKESLKECKLDVNRLRAALEPFACKCETESGPQCLFCQSDRRCQNYEARAALEERT